MDVVDLLLASETDELTVASIRRRAPQLDATREGLKAQLKELASASCSVFIESADCVKLVHTELARLSRHLEALESSLAHTATRPEVEEGIQARRRNTVLLSKHAGVLEVLEQPQLMDTCVRNGFIDEALELEAAARSRATVHADVPAIVQVAREVSAHMADLRDSLLTQLAGPLQLPDALRAVGYLRRIGTYALSEPELRIAFLRNRTLFFVQAEAALPRASAASYLLKYVDLCRVHWYDTLTHYRVVFAADEELQPAAHTGVANSSDVAIGFTRQQWVSCPTASTGDALAAMDVDGVTHVLTVPPLSAGEHAFETALPAEVTWGDPPNELAPGELAQAEQLGELLLGNWASERIGEFLQTLTAWLPRVQEGAFLANLIEQCAYSAKSLARVGLDISAIVRAPFRDAVLRLLDEGLTAAVEHWTDALAAHRWNAPHASAAAIASLAPPVASSIAEDAKVDGGAGRLASRSPPLALLQHPPVAVLLNHVLVVFNELRPCAPYELRRPIFERLRVALISCVRILAEIEQNATLSEQAHDHFRSLCGCMAEHLLPYVVACADQLVPRWTAGSEIDPTGMAGAGDREVSTLIDAVGEALRPLCFDLAADQGGDEGSAPAAPAADEASPPAADAPSTGVDAPSTALPAAVAPLSKVVALEP